MLTQDRRYIIRVHRSHRPCTSCEHSSIHLRNEHELHTMSSRRLTPPQIPKSHNTLTGGICLDIDDIALGPVCAAFIRKGDQGLHKDGILSPGLEAPHQPPRMVL